MSLWKSAFTFLRRFHFTNCLLIDFLSLVVHPNLKLQLIQSKIHHFISRLYITGPLQHTYGIFQRQCYAGVFSVASESYHTAHVLGVKVEDLETKTQYILDFIRKIVQHELITFNCHFKDRDIIGALSYRLIHEGALQMLARIKHVMSWPNRASPSGSFPGK